MMKKIRWSFLGLLLGVALGLLGSAVLSAQQNSFHPGSVPFTPTRMDWLIVELQACCRYDGLAGTGGFDLQFTNPDTETVLIYVTYLPTVDRAAMNVTIESVKRVIETKVRSYGWQDWVKVREDVHIGSSRP
jgi:hypothetical protein